MFLTAYIDESGTHDGSRYTLMSAVISDADRWRAFEQEWRRLLEQPLPGKGPITHVHGKDLKGRSKQFKGWTPPETAIFADKVSALLDGCCRFTVTAVLQNADYDAHYMPDKQARRQRTAVDSKYGVCFRILLSNLAALMQMHYPDSTILLVIEAGHSNGGAAETIYAQMAQIAPEMAAFITGITYVEKKKSPGVQGADLCVYPYYVLLSEGRELRQTQGRPADPLKKDKSTDFMYPITEETLKDLKKGQYLTSMYRKRYGKHWRQLDRFPEGWTAERLKSVEGFVLMPPPFVISRGSP